ncbi:hypothetical protein ACGFX4_11030 [Kitasatospora sp. NPDC048365]|uniref:hypothetical protein n=1 Tax=Kitasatospora sp. NPDC048365 TaxID=3364050 RepID=UPI0037126C13
MVHIRRLRRHPPGRIQQGVLGLAGIGAAAAARVPIEDPARQRHPVHAARTARPTAHRPCADRAVLDGGLAMAWTAIALATGESHRTSLLERLARRPPAAGQA